LPVEPSVESRSIEIEEHPIAKGFPYNRPVALVAAHGGCSPIPGLGPLDDQIESLSQRGFSRQSLPVHYLGRWPLLALGPEPISLGSSRQQDPGRWAIQEMKTTGYTLKLFFIGESKPVEVGLDEPGELFDLETQLEDALEQCRLFGWTDEDGEDFFVNPEQVALIEVPTWLLQDPESAEENEERPIGPEEAD
jgi:hypothetical protein